MGVDILQVRHIRPEEKVIADMLMNRVFVTSGGKDYTDWLNDPMKDTEGYENYWGCFDGKGTMASAFIVHPYQMRFDGHVTGMGGIGGVATSPESRGGGHIRAMFENAMREMYDRGMVFSYLYPFSHVFYRKFGYELCCVVNEAVVALKELAAYPRSGKVAMYKGEADINGIKAVYESFTGNMNLAIARDEGDFKRILDKDAYKTKQFTYIHSGDNGPDCYIIYDHAAEAGGNAVAIKELAWSSVSGLHGMLWFLAGLSAQFESLKWCPPGNVNAFALVPECYNVRQKSVINGMARIINLEAALGMMRYPAFGNGQINISVTDKFFPANTGAYLLEWENGQGIVKKLNGAQTGIDMELDVETAAQLLLGYLTPEEALLKGSVRIDGDMGVLSALFPRKTLCIFEKF
ncbi:MAG: GNAT family N-acetyltransferase [Clostridiales bacterium]|jgi:predicted acetyltransferase|nr:GNAT family N-acetyltransferase [Clostridiales bacterium]